MSCVLLKYIFSELKIDQVIKLNNNLLSPSFSIEIESHNNNGSSTLSSHTESSRSVVITSNPKKTPTSNPKKTPATDTKEIQVLRKIPFKKKNEASKGHNVNK